MASFRANGELELNGGKQYFPNEYCTLIEETNSKRTALTKVDFSGKKLLPIIDCRDGRRLETHGHGPRIPPPCGGAPDHFDGKRVGVSAGLARREARALDATYSRRPGDAW